MIDENLPYLKLGDVSDYVIILQNKLKILGFYDASVTGVFDNYTLNSVRDFQTDNNMDVTGEVDFLMWNILYNKTKPSFLVDEIEDRISRRKLRIGDSGDDVVELQQRLKELLYYDGLITGVFDEETKKAVQSFQTINKITSDGVVGVDTWSALIYLYDPLDECGETDEFYIVQKGDTLYSVARRYGISVDELKKMNNLVNNVISIGQKLLVGKLSDNSYYIVQKGDTLYSVARRYGISVDELKKMNNLVNNVISIGQKLLVGKSSENSSYIVQKGDTLYSVARRYGISVDELKRVNNLTNNIINIGDMLVIPN